MNTYSWLEQYGSAALGLSLVIEGVDAVFSTDAMPGTYTNDAGIFTAWDDPVGGLQIKGALHQAIKLYAQDLEPDSFSFRIIDPDGNLASLLREGYSSGHRTYLTSSVDAGSTSAINVKSTTGYSANGVIYIGDEAILHTGVTATTFTGITRGYLSVNQTNSSALFAPAHLIGNNVVVSATTAPAVTDYPKTWFGRFVHLFLHVKDPLTGVYNTPSEAVKLWSGRIQSYGDDGDGGYSIDAKSSIDLLYKPVGMQQWHAHCNEGKLIATGQDSLTVTNTVGAYAPVADLTSLSDAVPKSHEEIAGYINTQFEAWRSAVTTSAGDLWDLTLTDTGDGGPPRYRFTLQPNTTAVASTARVEVGLSLEVWTMLGWDGNDTGSVTLPSGDRVIRRSLGFTSTARWQLTAPGPPIVAFGFSTIPNTTIALSDEIGTFFTQTADEMQGAPPDANGAVAVSGIGGEGIFAVTYTAGSPSTLRFVASLDLETGIFIPLQYGNASGSNSTGTDTQWDGAMRLGEVSEPPTVKQAWVKNGPAGSLLLEALLSTSGGSGYNHATYDTLSWGGCGVPSSLIDAASWKCLDDAQMQFVITEPKPFYEYLEPVLNVTNRYMVWKAASATSQPKMTVMRPTFDNSVRLDWTLTESNKADSPGRLRVRRGVDGVINRVVVKYGYGLAKDDSGASQIIIEDVASQSDYGRRRTVTLNAPMVTNVLALASAAITPALAYCARPLALATRTYNAGLLRMVPGDCVSVTDNYAVDPATGVRGAVLYGWVLSTDFDLASGRGLVEIVFLPEKVSRVALYAPSARCNGSYNAGTKTLTTVAHEFSTSFDVNDSANFVAGDKVHVYQLDAASPLEWFDTVAAVGTNTIQVTTGLTAPAFDATKTYVVEYDDIVTAVTSQRVRAFIADDADLSTGGAISTPFDWGADGSTTLLATLGASVTPDYTQGMFEPPTAGYAEKGQPLSVHKAYYAAKSVNSLLAYKTRNVYINQYLQNNATVIGTTRTVVYLGWIPIYGHVGFTTTRGLICRLRGKTSSGTATFTIRSSPTAPTGAAFSSVTYPFGSTVQTFATASTSFVWSDELTLTCSGAPAIAGNSLWGTWVAVEAVASGGGITATLADIFVCEAELS